MASRLPPGHMPRPCTLADALALKVGDYLCTPHTKTPRKPVRVTAVWRNYTRTIVLVRLYAIDRDAWLDATGYELPPVGLVWDKDGTILGDSWVDKAAYDAERARLAELATANRAALKKRAKAGDLRPALRLVGDNLPATASP